MSKLSLSQQIADLQAGMLPQIPEETLTVLLNGTQDLINSGIADKALQANDACPDFTLPNALSNDVSLSQKLANGPLVISFYRGAWCPYCNLEIKALADSLSSIRDCGADLIAISPQVVSKAEQQTTALDLTFDVLSDAGNSVAKSFGLVFPLAENARPIYDAFEFDIPGHNGDDLYEMPIPATYIVDGNQVIRHAYVNADYTQRLEPSVIIEQLKEL